MAEAGPSNWKKTKQPNTATISSHFKVGDLVWAKIRGFSSWPAKIAKPGKKVKLPNLKKPMHYVIFYGYKNEGKQWSAWVVEQHMHKYEEKREEFSKKNNTVRFQEAILEIESEYRANAETIQEDSGSRIEEIEDCLKPPGKRLELRPVIRPLDGIDINNILKAKNVHASKQKVGFLGSALMGHSILNNLIESGHDITLYTKSTKDRKLFAKAGADICTSPKDVMESCDFTFSYSDNAEDAKENVFSAEGVLSAVRPTKGYIEMTTLDPETASMIAEQIVSKGGKFLEAPFFGTIPAASKGMLLILAAGDISLFESCSSCFEAMASEAFYLGQTGNGNKMDLLMKMMLGTASAALAEAMNFAEKLDISKKDLMEMIEIGPLSCPIFSEMGENLVSDKETVNIPLRYMQSCMQMGVTFGNQYSHPIPMLSMVNETYKRAKVEGFGDHDITSIYSWNIDKAKPETEGS